MTRIAFYAPLKPPDHPTPSGDRRMGRLFIDALKKAGYNPEIASTLRVRDGLGDRAIQATAIENAGREIERLTNQWRADPPSIWFTYHCYYKAPDLIGPTLADRFAIPYVIAEASRARKRRGGPWDGFARRADTAIDRADLLLAMTAHDRFALDRDAKDGQHIVDFPPFLDPGPDPVPKRPSATLRLLTVAMMRGADKLASYRALAEALHGLDTVDWRLTIIGDGPERAAVDALFRPYGDRVSFGEMIADASALRPYYETADALVWPGVNEAYGMIYLEAQAAGTPVIAEDWPGPRSVIAPASAIVPQGDAEAFRSAILRVTNDAQICHAVRRYVLDGHSLDAASMRLGDLLGDLR